MKIVGFVILIVCAILLSEVSFAMIPTCKGSVFTKLDTGEYYAERIQFVPQDFTGNMVASVENGKLRFVSQKKSDEWTYYTYSDQRELLRIRGYRNMSEFHYTKMRLNQETFFKFRDRGIFGFNVVCRI